MSGFCKLFALGFGAALALVRAGAAQAEPVGESATGEAADITRPAPISTEAFASRSPFGEVRLSPDGSQIVTLVQVEGKEYITLVDAERRVVTRRYVVPDNNDVEWIRWAGNGKLLFSLSQLGALYGEELLYTRLAVIELASGAMEVLGKRFPAVVGDDVIFVAEDGAYALVAIQRSLADYPSVIRFELAVGGDAAVVQAPKAGVWDWVADNQGVVRLGLGYQRQSIKVWYRASASDEFKVVDRVTEDNYEDKFWNVAQVVSGSDHAYILREGESGRTGLYLFDLKTRTPVETVYEHPEYDVDSVQVRDGKPIAAFYTDDRDRVHWFDPKQARLYAALDKALPEDEVWVLSRAKDDSRMLVWAGGASDPGGYYIYTPAKNTLHPLLNLRPAVPVPDLAEPKPFTYTARDGTKIAAYLTLPRGREAKNLPLIVLPHGGPYGIRDKLSYDDEVQLLANRGYAVIQPNFRGSGGYGDAFFELGTGQIGRGMQDDVDDAMDWAVAEGIADKNRVCVVGSSYGGYAAMWAVIRNPERYRCAASWAGVTDWNLILKYDKRFFTRKAGEKWVARVQGQEDFDLDSVSPYRLASTLKRPLLIAQGKVDTTVPYSQFTKFRSAAAKASVKPVELVFDNEGHSFQYPENRQKWFDTLTAFLAQHNPAD